MSQLSLINYSTKYLLDLRVLGSIRKNLIMCPMFEIEFVINLGSTTLILSVLKKCGFPVRHENTINVQKNGVYRLLVKIVMRFIMDQLFIFWRKKRKKR